MNQREHLVMSARRAQTLVVLLALLLVGCTSLGSTPGDGRVSGTDPSPPSVSTTDTERPSTGVIRSSGPITDRWPPALAAAVLGYRDGFSVVDRQGIVFTERRARPPEPEAATTSTVWGPEEPVLAPGISGRALSANRRLVAYSFPGEDLVVRSLRTGAIERRMTVPVAAANEVRAVSDDGRYVALGLSRLLKNETSAAGPHWAAPCVVLGRARSAATSAPCVLALRVPSALPLRGVILQQPVRPKFSP